jgi:hypothetical protein
MMGDDVAASPFFRDLGLDMLRHISPRMIVRWPLAPWNESSVKACPRIYQILAKTHRLLPSAVNRAVAIHMHNVPMDVAWDWVRGTPPDAGVFFLDANVVQFCVLE